jgi:hypothetical protein
LGRRQFHVVRVRQPVAADMMANPPASMTSRLPLRSAQEVVYLGAALLVALGGGQ